MFFWFFIGITDEFDDDDDLLYGNGKDDDDLHHPFAVTDRAIPNPFANGGVAAEKLNPVIFMKIIKNFMKIIKNFMKIIKRSIFQTFWKTYSCPDFLFLELETSNLGYLPIFYFL